MTQQVRKEQVWKTAGGNTEKEAELAGTWDMPTQGAPSTVNRADEKKLSVPKTAQVQRNELVDDFLNSHGMHIPGGEVEKTAEGTVKPDPDKELAEAFGVCCVEGEQPAGNPQVKKTLQPHVDVTSAEPPKVIQEKSAEFSAMPSIGRYPLDNYHQVKAASAYFNENHKLMEPEDRREFAINMVKRASALNIPVSDLAEHYAAPGYASDVHLQIEVDGRRPIIKEAEHLELLDELMEAKYRLSPEVFARTLGEIDKLAGIAEFYGSEINDPFYATFGKSAQEQKKEDPKDAVIIGNEYMTVRDLKAFAESGDEAMKKRFGEDVTTELQKDPTGIFDSLPRDQKLVIMRMVNSSNQGKGTEQTAQ